MTQYQKQRTGRVLQGWIWLLPVIALPLSIIGVEVWINVQIYANSYQESTLIEDKRELGEQIQELRREAASVAPIDHVAQWAPELGLEMADPDRVIRITERQSPDEGGHAQPGEPDYRMAQMDYAGE